MCYNGSASRDYINITNVADVKKLKRNFKKSYTKARLKIIKMSLRL